MPGSKRAGLKRMFTPWKSKREEKTQAGEEEALPGLAMLIGNSAMNAALYMEELQAKLPPQAPGLGEEEAVFAAADTSDEADSAAETDTEADTNTVMSGDPMSDLYNKLRTSKRGGLHRHSGNSEQYEGVMSILTDINAAMGRSFSADSRSNIRQVQNMEAMYRNLIKACDTYIDHVFVRLTKKGRQRKRIVRQIRELAIQDMLGLAETRMELRSMPEEQQSGKNWREIVEKARTLHLKVQNFSKLGTASGGQASEVYKIKDNNGDTEGTGVRVQGADGSEQALSELHFFKPEDEFDLSKATIAGKIVNKTLERFPMLSEEEKELIRQSAMAADVPMEPAGLSANGKLVFAALQNNAKGAKVTYDELMKPSGIADEGGRINMTKRNVATSRMAALLGLEHLVAKSQEVEIYDEATGNSFRGNLMEKAEGMQMRDEFTPAYKKAAPARTAVRVSKSAQRDLINLQILDVLCGQMDRHSGNIMVKLNRPADEAHPMNGTETIEGIQGIDNDASFGMNTDVVSVTDANRKDRRAYDPKTGQMTLPFMDKNLASNILELRPEVVRFALKGLITDAEIDAAIQRLELMKNAIRNTPGDRFRLMEDDDWNDDTAYTLFKMHWESGDKLDEQRRAEVKKLVQKAIPKIAAKKYDDRTKEEKAIFSDTEFAIMKKLKLKKYQPMQSSMSNYFGRFMEETMGVPFMSGDAPEELWRRAEG